MLLLVVGEREGWCAMVNRNSPNWPQHGKILPEGKMVMELLMVVGGVCDSWVG